MPVDVGSAVGYLDLDVSGFLAGLKTAQAEATTASKNWGQIIGEGFESAGAKISSAGKMLTTAVSVPLAGVGIAGLKVATDFEKGMSNVQAISGATGEEFESLRKQAIDLGGSTAFSAKEVSEAMTEMAKAGWSSQQILDGMSGVLDAAAASGESLGGTATIVADSITGFGLAASDSARVADLLTKAANAGTIGVADLGESFKYIAPVASSMGYSIEEITTAVSAMSMAGIKGSQAGTSLRGVLTRMVKPTDDVKAAMEELGFTLANQDGTFKPLNQSLSEMRAKFAGMTDEQKTYYAALLAGQEGMSGLLSLVNLSQEEYDAMSNSMNNAAGTAQATASIMQNNLASKIEQFKGSLESLAIKMADYVLPQLTAFAVKLTEMVDKFSQMDEATQKSILKFAGIAIIAGPVLFVFGKLVSVIGGFINVMAGIGPMLTKLSVKFAEFQATSALTLGPILAIVAAIAVLIAAFVTLWKTNEDFRNKVISIWETIKSSFEGFVKGITDRMAAIGITWEDVINFLKEVWFGLCDVLAPIFIGVFNVIATTIQYVFDTITGILDIFIGLFTGNWDQMWLGIQEVFGAFWTYITQILQNALTMIGDVVNVFLGWFGLSWQGIWTSIKDFFIGVWNGLVSFIVTTCTTVKDFFVFIWTTIFNFFNFIITSIVDFITSRFNGVFEGIKMIFEGIFLYFSGVWEVIKNVFLGFILIICDLVTGNFDKLKSDISHIFENIKNAIGDIWNGIFTFFKGIITAIVGFIEGMFSSLFDAVSFIFNKIFEFYSNLWTNIFNFVFGIKDKIVNGAVNVFESMVNGIANTVGKIKDTVVNGFLDAISYITSLPDQAITWGKDMIDGIVKGITSSIGKVGDAVSGVADKIRSFLHFSVPDEGPLTDYETWMPDMVFGLTKTLKASTPRLIEQVKSLASGMSDTFLSMKDVVGSSINNTMLFDVNVKKKTSSEGTSQNDTNNPDTNKGGDTYNFYSQSKLSEVECKREMEQAKRELALDF